MCAWWASHPPSATRCYGWFHTFSHHSNIYIYQSNTNILKTVEIWIWIISKNKRNLQDSNHFRLIYFNPMSSFGWFVVEKSHFPPFFFPPCFFDPRWQNPWNYVGGDKGPQRHVDTSGFTPDEKKAVAWISGSISTFTDTSRLLWIPIFRYDFIYIYIYAYIHTNLHTYIFLNHLHQWCLTSAFLLKEKTCLLKDKIDLKDQRPSDTRLGFDGELHRNGRRERSKLAQTCSKRSNWGLKLERSKNSPSQCKPGKLGYVTFNFEWFWIMIGGPCSN